MARFRKDVLRPGTYSVPDPSGRRRRVTYSPSDVIAMAESARQMLAAGISPPLCWEHQDDAQPCDRLANSARHNLGFVEKLEVDDSGALVAVLDVPDDADAKRLPSARYVSPEIIQDYVDGSGRKWPGPVITHVAVTPRPVQHTQQPFQRLSVVRLSLADRLGEKQMADEKDDKEGGDLEGGDVKKILKALEALGVSLPSDTTMENLTDRLIGAAAAKGGIDDGGATAGEAEPTEVPAGPVAMSLARMQERLLKNERQGLERRIKALFPAKVSKPIRDKLLADLGKVRLSLDAQGELVAGSLLAKVEAYEELPTSGLADAGRLSQAREVEPPEGHLRGAPLTEKETDAVIKQWDEAVRRR